MIFRTVGRAPARSVRVAAGVSALAVALALANPAWAQVLSLPEALCRAAGADPAAAAADARAQAAQAGLRQADVKPNPVVGLDVENAAGTGPYSLIEQTETTLYYQQTLERGGKRAARRDVARSDIEVARLRREVLTLDLFKAVETAWVDALAAEAQVRVAEQRLAAAERLQAEVGRRVRAARDPLFAGARADTQVAQARIALDQARTAAEDARAALARFWGGTADFDLDFAAFENLSAAEAAAGEPATADLELLDAVGEGAAARVRLEQSRAVQDPTVRVGVRHFWEGQDLALVVGGSMPLARYDTNRGGIERAQAERLAAERDVVAARAAREREIARLQARLSASATEVRRIDAEVLPPAERTVSLVREGFNRGGFSYIDVVEAQRALIDARARRVDVLKAFHLDRAALDRLTGRHAGLVPAQETPR